MVDALCIAPAYDLATYRTSTAAKITVTILRQYNFEVDILEREEATRDKFESLLSERFQNGKDPWDLIVYFGHGTPESLIGQSDGYDRPLVDLNNVVDLSGSIVAALACYSLKQLGNRSISTKTRAYIGWNDLLYLPDTIEGERNFQGDFLRTFVLIPLCLAKGYSVHDTVTEFKSLCDEYITMYLSGTLHFGEDAAFMMTHNRDFIDYAGRPDTKIEAGVVV